MNQRTFEELQNKVCIITGGAGVIGTVLSESLARQGIKMAILDVNLKNAEKAALEIERKTNTRAIAVEADVLNKNSLFNAMVMVNQQLGPINFLINGAGGNSPKATTGLEMIDISTLKDLESSFYGLDIDGFREVFDLNLFGTVLPTMVFTMDMIKAGKGSVINISSMNAFRPLTRIPAYSAAKASVNNFTEWIAVHLAKTGIRVNAIAPGFFVTNQNRFLLYNEKTGELSARGKKIIANTPMGKFGSPDHLVGAVLFLLSDLSSYITGITLPVDGGFNAYSGV